MQTDNCCTAALAIHTLGINITLYTRRMALMQYCVSQHMLMVEADPLALFFRESMFRGVSPMRKECCHAALNKRERKPKLISFFLSSCMAAIS